MRRKYLRTHRRFPQPLFSRRACGAVRIRTQSSSTIRSQPGARISFLEDSKRVYVCVDTSARARVGDLSMMPEFRGISRRAMRKCPGGECMCVCAMEVGGWLWNAEVCGSQETGWIV